MCVYIYIYIYMHVYIYIYDYTCFGGVCVFTDTGKDCE